MGPQRTRSSSRDRELKREEDPREEVWLKMEQKMDAILRKVRNLLTQMDLIVVQPLLQDAQVLGLVRRLQLVINSRAFSLQCSSTWIFKRARRSVRRRHEAGQVWQQLAP